MHRSVAGLLLCLLLWAAPALAVVLTRSLPPGIPGTITAGTPSGTGLQPISEISGADAGTYTVLKFSNGSITPNGDGTATITTGVGGGGDFSSNTTSSADGETVVFADAFGKTGRRSTLTATVVKSTGGILGAATAGTDYVAPGGNVATATALAANGANCPDGQAPLGVNAQGAAEGCFDVVSQAVLDAHTGSVTAHSATSANASNRIVLRDASGNFSAGIITATISGNATTATALASNGANCAAGSVAQGVDAAGNAEGCTPVTTGTGTGDFSSNTSTSANGEVVLFADAFGKTGRRSTLTATVVKSAGGILSAATAGTDYVVPGGNVATATALAANGGNCPAGQFPLGVNASGAVEGCTDAATQLELDGHESLTAAHSATSSNTASRIVLRDASGNFSAGTITATLSGNASTATQASALAANGSNCAAGQFPLGVDASGAAEGCTPMPTTMPFSAITGSTNTTAAMILGPGATLTAVGGGQIVATDFAGSANYALKTGINQRITGTFVDPREVAYTPSGGAITPNLDTTGTVVIDGLAAPLFINAPLGTGGFPAPSHELIFRFKSSTPQTLTWLTTAYTNENGTPLPGATSGTDYDYFKFVYNSTSAKWGLVATTLGVNKGVTTLTSSANYTCPWDRSSLCEMQMTAALPPGVLSVEQPTPTTGMVNGTLMRMGFLCTNPQTFNWHTIFQPSPNVPLPTACPADTTKWTVVGVQWSSVLNKWQMLSVNVGTTAATGLQPIAEIDGAPSGTFTMLKFSNGSVTDNGDGTATISTGNPSGGDASTNTSTSIDNEGVLFSGGGGKTLKRETLTATVVKSTAGVRSAATAGTDYVVPGGNVATATALATNAANCPAGQFPLGVDASGAVEGCTDAATQLELDAHEASTTAHSATSSNTVSRIVLRDASGNFSAGNITASINGNATTASALATNGSNCGAGLVAQGVDTQGNAEGCTAVGGDFFGASSSLDNEVVLFSGTSGKTGKRSTLTATVVKSTAGILSAATAGTDYVVPGGNVATATALAANGSNCPAGQFPLGVDASGIVEGCTDAATQLELDAHVASTTAHSATSSNTASRIVLRDASGNFSAGTITAALTGNATSATALANNGSNCSAGQFPSGVDASGNAEGCTVPIVGHTLKDESVSLTQRSGLNMVGAGITCVDNVGANSTDCTVPADVVTTTANAWADNVRQTFNPGVTVAGLNVGSQAADPSTPVNGDLWYQSTANELRARINGATVSLGGEGTVHAADYGVVCDGTTDTAPMLQTAVNAAKVGTVGRWLSMPLPTGSACKLGSTVTISNVAGFGLDGHGALFTWSGNTTTPMFLFQDARESVVRNFKVVTSATTPVRSVFHFENGSGSTVTPTHNVVQDVFIECTNGGCTDGIRMAVGAGGDANNEFNTFTRVSVNNVTRACASIEHSQSKTNLFNDFECANNGIGQYAINVLHGSFHCVMCRGGGNTVADFFVTQTFDPILITGGNFENSKRLLETDGSSGATMTMTLRNIRWNMLQLNADNEAIIYKFKGPLILENLQLEPASLNRPVAIRYQPGGNFGSFLATGNAISSTLANPFTGIQPTVAEGNLIDRNDGAGWTSLDTGIRLGPATAAQLSTLPWSTAINGTLTYCSDCTIAAACTGGGTGALATRLGGAWTCGSSATPTTPQGNTNEVQYNTGGGFGGSGGLTLNSTAITGLAHNVTPSTASLTLGVHNIIACDATAGVRTYTAPTAASSTLGKTYRIIKVDSSANACTVLPATGQRFNHVVDAPKSITTQDAEVVITLMDIAVPNWQVTVTVAVAGVPQGGTGLASGTSGGIPYFNTTTTMGSSAALGANLPVFGGGAGATPFTGTRSGNTTEMATSTGTKTVNKQLAWDANGNVVASASDIGGGGGGTGTVQLWPGFITLPDGSAGNAFASSQVVQSTGTAPTNAPKVHFTEMLFDPATDQHVISCFDMPSDYTSGGTLRIKWKRNAGTTAQNAIWKGAVAALTPGAGEVPNTKVFAAAALSSTDAAGTTTNGLIQSTITLTMDSAAANDYVCVMWGRDADNASDTLADATGVVSVKLEYAK